MFVNAASLLLAFWLSGKTPEASVLFLVAFTGCGFGVAANYADLIRLCGDRSLVLAVELFFVWIRCFWLQKSV